MSLRDELAHWARSEGLAWIFICKMLAAALTTLWLAMRLEMPQPSTAVMAVFIVMQPQSGQVLAKSLHRLLGTVVGLAAMLPLLALFAQEPVLFLGGMALWVALCTAGAARYRDLRSYSCVLAGYTATLIGLTAIQHPETAFVQALWRVLEIGLGVLCCSLFSAAVLPQSTGAAMREAIARRFGAFATQAVTHLPGGERAAFETAQARLAAQTVRLETLRSMSGYDDPQLALRMGRLTRLNHDFMAMTSRFHALQQLLGRLRGQGAELALEAFAPCLDSLVALLAPWRQRALDCPAAAALATQLEDYRARLLPLIRQCRADLAELPADSPLRLDFDTAAELLYRLAGDLHEYALTHAALAPARHARERRSERFAPRANRLAVAAAALRMLLLVALGSAFWLQSAWPSGHMFLISAVIIGALCSASANPARMALQMAGGTFLAALLGFVESFLVFPQISGFPMLALAVTPVFLLGLYLATRPRWAGYGLGLLILFGFGTLPANLTVHDPAGLLNHYIALVLSQLLVAAVMACVLPPNRPWLWRQLERDLRRRVPHVLRAAQGAGSALRQLDPRPADPGPRPRRRAPRGAARPAALDDPGAGDRPCGDRAAPGEGAPARRVQLRRRHRLAAGLRRPRRGAGAAVRPAHAGAPAPGAGRGRAGHRRAAAHSRGRRTALRQLAAAPPGKPPALHPHRPARPAFAAGRTPARSRPCCLIPCRARSPSMACCCPASLRCSCSPCCWAGASTACSPGSASTAMPGTRACCASPCSPACSPASP